MDFVLKVINYNKIWARLDKNTAFSTEKNINTTNIALNKIIYITKSGKNR